MLECHSDTFVPSYVYELLQVEAKIRFPISFVTVFCHVSVYAFTCKSAYLLHPYLCFFFKYLFLWFHVFLALLNKNDFKKKFSELFCFKSLAYSLGKLISLGVR